MFSISRRAVALVLAAIIMAVFSTQATPDVAVANHSFFIVNSTGDAGDAAPGDGACKTSVSVCTLRAAIQEANVHAGNDTIVIDASLGASPVILPLSALPNISQSLTLNGLALGGTRTEIKGGAAGAGADGLRLFGGSSVISNVVINRFNGSGVLITGGVNVVRDSFIGTDATGTAAIPNGAGILLGASSNAILNNVISGNAFQAISLFSGANTAIRGNTIGLNAAGTAIVANGSDGILLSGGSNTVIGGTTAANRNVISGNGGSGITTNPGVTGTTIHGNYIGTDGTGEVALGNVFMGVQSLGSSDVIGGAAVADRNIISGNGISGVRLHGPTPVVQGNYIGTDKDGVSVVGNTNEGVYVASNDALVDDNVISGNGSQGILIFGDLASIQSNKIGTDAGGTAALANLYGVDVSGSVNTLVGASGVGNIISGNTQEGLILRDGADQTSVHNNLIGVGTGGVTPLGNGLAGILIDTGAKDNTVGDPTVPNVIANNAIGIQLPAGAGTGNEIFGNSIHSNAGLGIDLAGAGVTANDLGDPDAGPNSTQNYPVLTSAQLSGGSLTISGTLNSIASSNFLIDMYASPTCDPSGNGEGTLNQTLALVSATTDGAGNAAFTVSYPSALPAGYAITATASTLAPNPDTSEFSACVLACPGGDPDCDGFTDVAPPTHTGPANTNTAFDNCPGVANPNQLNKDGNFIQLNPPKLYNDLTLANSDGLGDACDPDDDNDGRTDVDEASGAGCGGIATNPLLRDTDGDRMLDGAECTLATNPTLINAAPAACLGAGDADADGVLDSREVCFYGTSTSSNNTDGDNCKDGREIASINGDLAVNVVDLQQIASESGTYVSPGSVVQVNFDITKNGQINVVDLQQAAVQIGVCP